ncbi:aminotransferase class IV [Flavisolibacter ginsenosidimutans]|uniref:branched-chain-amino-acid transaminase n=1 Tax=Flavisolibacter ginsenosidimutans TaxID=661481 RepID=A0A5B8UI84_9BACT|nr:aminotransferase class IV [Flavisolibacter ginsenosidimutans]QEC56233.1 amino acid aminotransferase [Flavisolibacter ginsenosidimutans]
MKTKQVFLNGDFIEEPKAMLHFTDLSFQRGYGIFDFFRLVEMEPLFFEEHLDRFYSSAQNMHLQVPVDRGELVDVIHQLIQKNSLPNSGIRISLTGGYSTDGFNPGKPNLILSQHTFSTPSEEQREKGIRLLSHSYQRQLPHVKTIDYLMAIWLQPLKTQNGADDILYHANWFITECPRSNFFLVTGDNRIVTPAENILQGITRAKVIELAKKTHTVEVRPVRWDEIKTAKEAFITSTTKQLLSVAQIDEKVFSEREISTDLLQRFRSAYRC